MNERKQEIIISHVYEWKEITINNNKALQREKKMQRKVWIKKGLSGDYEGKKSKKNTHMSDFLW